MREVERLQKLSRQLQADKDRATLDFNKRIKEADNRSSQGSAARGGGRPQGQDARKTVLSPNYGKDYYNQGGNWNGKRRRGGCGQGGCSVQLGSKGIFL